jgi:hypothetical protein
MTMLRLFEETEFSREIRPHPCPYYPHLIQRFAAHLHGCRSVLDPLAGTGRIHQLQTYGYDTVGVELEPGWKPGGFGRERKRT